MVDLFVFSKWSLWRGFVPSCKVCLYFRTSKLIAWNFPCYLRILRHCRGANAEITRKTSRHYLKLLERCEQQQMSSDPSREAHRLVPSQQASTPCRSPGRLILTKVYKLLSHLAVDYQPIGTHLFVLLGV